jgi:hypothetical protein
MARGWRLFAESSVSPGKPATRCTIATGTADSRGSRTVPVGPCRSLPQRAMRGECPPPHLGYPRCQYRRFDGAMGSREPHLDRACRTPRPAKFLASMNLLSAWSRIP